MHLPLPEGACESQCCAYPTAVFMNSSDVLLTSSSLAGTAVATQIAAAEAGADIVDCAIDSMSGLTSQPSMGAIVNALAGTRLDTGINPRHMLLLSNYWWVQHACYFAGCAAQAAA
jgi:pyruvate carboxylase